MKIIQSKVMLTSLEDVSVIESLVSGVVTSEDKKSVSTQSTSAVICSWEWSISATLLKTPLAVIIRGKTKDIDLVVRSDLSILLFIIKSSEQNV